MSIHGTITLEDQTIQFYTNQPPAGPDTVHYCVNDQLTGEGEDRTVPARAFFIALALAVHHDGDFPQDAGEHDAQWALAESVQPTNPACRFIP